VRHTRISRSPGATVFHAGGADRGYTPAPDYRVPAANGSGRILWTRRSNEGGPADCALDDPSFAMAVSTCSLMRKRTTAPSFAGLAAGTGKEVTPRTRSPSGGAFRGMSRPKLA
ncbi:hypothetical protein, partial [Novacetimonas hansenii]|uniref:hypothetical protein n=1 Tax=Novacetimonas hansenii TaxID=436 RepID=UPI0014776344